MQVWNSLEIAKFTAALATPIVVALVGFWVNSRLKARDRRLYREDEPHIELKLDCRIHGLRGDKYLATFTVSAANVGRVEHKFDEIWLRVRGIKDDPFEYDADNEPHDAENAPPTEDEHSRRASFPHLLFKRNLVPATKTTKWNYIFIEPGVKQNVSFTTLVPSDYSYLLTHVRFEYEKYRPHTAEAVFAVPQEVSG